MKRIYFTLLLLLFPTVAFSQFWHDRAVYLQVRSIETGPWQFEPEYWYYSWFNKKVKFLGINWGTHSLPGLGIHDRGFGDTRIGGDRYVRDYYPNTRERAKMLGIVLAERKMHEKMKDQVNKAFKKDAKVALDKTSSKKTTKYTFDREIEKLNEKALIMIAKCRRLGIPTELIETLKLERHSLIEKYDNTCNVYESTINKNEIALSIVEDFKVLNNKIAKIYITKYQLNKLNN